MRILGITGTNGAGKGTIVAYLMERHGFLHFSVRSYLISVLKKQRSEPTRDNMIALANQIRAEQGPQAMAEILYREAARQGGASIIESIRTVGEIEALHSKGPFWLIAVDAEQRLRYQRIVRRNSETDRISWEQFLQAEQKEMHSADPNKQNIQACIELADFRLDNNGSFEELHQQVEGVLKALRPAE